jgi:uncharacterized membrane protein
MKRPSSGETGALLALALVLGACSSATSPSASEADAGGAGAGCPVALACSDAGAPSYAAVIEPILEQACIPCHSTQGTAGFYETSYTDVYNQRSPIFDQVTQCLMPPTNGPQLTAAQRVALSSWLECGAPNN